MLYDRAACLATTIPDGMRHFCPTEDAMLAMELALLAFLVLVVAYIVEGVVMERRELRRRRRFEELYGHRQEGNANGQHGVGTTPTPWL